MPRIYIAFCWAAAMLALALFGRLGWVEPQAVALLLILMPALALVSLLNGGCCRRAGRA